MDIASLIGISGALLLIAFATGGKFMQFIDLPAIAIVFGGTTMCVLAKSTLPEFRSAFATARRALSSKPETVDGLIEELVEIGKIARYDDRWMVVLEDREFNNDFLAKAVRLWVDGLDYHLLKDALTREVAEEKIRFDQARDFFSFAQEIAPGMGMIGTLLGLVLMMGNMTDPRAIGPGMAVALLTTLYGAILANVLLSPLVHKIISCGRKVRYNYELVVVGMLFLHKGGDPRLLPDLLLASLPKSVNVEPEPVPEPEA
jgi:chemotaxis protein MotA